MHTEDYTSYYTLATCICTYTGAYTPAHAHLVCQASECYVCNYHVCLLISRYFIRHEAESSPTNPKP